MRREGGQVVKATAANPLCSEQIPSASAMHIYREINKFSNLIQPDRIITYKTSSGFKLKFSSV